MNEKRIYTIKDLPVDKTDWKALSRLSDKEISARANSDPNAHLSTINELKNFKRVHAHEEFNVKAVREKLK